MSLLVRVDGHGIIVGLAPLKFIKAEVAVFELLHLYVDLFHLYVGLFDLLELFHLSKKLKNIKKILKWKSFYKLNSSISEIVQTVMNFSGAGIIVVQMEEGQSNAIFILNMTHKSL